MPHFLRHLQSRPTTVRPTTVSIIVREVFHDLPSKQIPVLRTGIAVPKGHNTRALYFMFPTQTLLCRVELRNPTYLKKHLLNIRINDFLMQFPQIIRVHFLDLTIIGQIAIDLSFNICCLRVNRDT